MGRTTVKVVEAQDIVAPSYNNKNQYFISIELLYPANEPQKTKECRLDRLMSFGEDFLFDVPRNTMDELLVVTLLYREQKEDTAKPLGKLQMSIHADSKLSHFPSQRSEWQRMIVVDKWFPFSEIETSTSLPKPSPSVSRNKDPAGIVGRVHLRLEFVERAIRQSVILPSCFYGSMKDEVEVSNSITKENGATSDESVSQRERSWSKGKAESPNNTPSASPSPPRKISSSSGIHRLSNSPVPSKLVISNSASNNNNGDNLFVAPPPERPAPPAPLRKDSLTDPSAASTCIHSKTFADQHPPNTNGGATNITTSDSKDESKKMKWRESQLILNKDRNNALESAKHLEIAKIKKDYNEKINVLNRELMYREMHETVQLYNRRCNVVVEEMTFREKDEVVNSYGGKLTMLLKELNMRK